MCLNLQSKQILHAIARRKAFYFHRRTCKLIFSYSF